MMDFAKNEITVSAQGRMFTVKVCGAGSNNAGDSKRSAITLFSRASRLRLLQKMATIKTKGLKSVFVTLTYGQEFPSPKTAKRHLDNFLKRIGRAYENVSGFWRMEFQQRGAPHFHVIFFGLPYIDKDDLATMWGEIVGNEFWDNTSNPQRPPFTRIELLSSHKHAARYVAKYVAKSDSDGGFNIAPYLTVRGDFIHPVTGEVDGKVGRWWGVFNAAALPLADLVEIVVNGYGSAALMTLKRALAATKWRVDPANRFGFFLFEDNPMLWVEYFEEAVRMTA